MGVVVGMKTAQMLALYAAGVFYKQDPFVLDYTPTFFRERTQTHLREHSGIIEKTTRTLDFRP
jgi:hypothetical protein